MKLLRPHDYDRQTIIAICAALMGLLACLLS